MNQGQKYYIYLGEYCEYADTSRCSDLDSGALAASSILIAEAACP
jgi:hypothetical protein